MPLPVYFEEVAWDIGCGCFRLSIKDIQGGVSRICKTVCIVKMGQLTEINIFEELAVIVAPCKNLVLP